MLYFFTYIFEIKRVQVKKLKHISKYIPHHIHLITRFQLAQQWLRTVFITEIQALNSTILEYLSLYMW